MDKVTGGSVVWNLDVDDKAFEAGLSKAQTKVREVAKEGERSFSSMAKSIGSTLTSLGSSISDFGDRATVGISAPVTAFLLGSQKLASATGRYYSVLDSFKSMTKEMGIDADEFQKSIAEATGNQVDNLSILRNATRGLSLIGKEAFNDFGQDFVKMAELSKKAARATGQDVDYMFDSLVMGIARESKLILDNLGLNIDITRAKDEYAQSLGKTSDELTQSEEKHAVLSTAMRELEGIYGDVAISAGGFSGAMQELRTVFTNALVGSESFDQNMGKITKSLIPLAEEWLPKKVEMLGNLAEKFINLDPNMQRFIINMTALAVVGPPAISILGRMISSIGTGLTGAIKVASVAYIGFANLLSFAMGGGVIKNVASATSAFKLFGTILKTVVIPQVWAFTVALLANPLTWIVLAVVAAVGLLYLAWTKNWGGIQEKTQAVFDWFGSAFEWLKTVPDQIGKKWEEFKNQFTATWETIKTSVKTKFEEIIEFFEGIPSAVGRFLLELPFVIAYGLGYATGTLFNWAEAIWDFWTVTVPAWIDAIGAWFSELPERISVWLDDLYNRFMIWGSETWTYLSTQVTMMIDNVVIFFSQLPDKIWTFLVDLKNRFILWGMGVWSYLSENVPRWIEGVVNWVRELPDKIKSALSNLLDSLKGSFIEAWEATLAEIKTWPGRIMEWGKNLGKAFVDGVKNALGGLKNAFISGFNDARGSVEGKSPPKEGPFKQIDKWGYNVGLAWVEGAQKAFSDFGSLLNGFVLENPIQANVTYSNEGYRGGVVVNVQEMNVNEEADVKRVGREIGFRVGVGI